MRYDMKKLFYYLVLFFNCGDDNCHEFSRRRTECHMRNNDRDCHWARKRTLCHNFSR